MKNHLEPILEQQIDLALRQLPVRKAPPTLAPRVMAAIETRKQRAWWQRPCWTWPLSIQITAMVIYFAGLSGLFWLGNAAVTTDWMSSTPSWISGFGGYLLSLGRGFISLAEAGSLVINTLLRPWLLVGMGIIFLMYLSCLGVGTLFVRFAYRRL
jgi:hypothetical protein